MNAEIIKVTVEAMKVNIMNSGMCANGFDALKVMISKNGNIMEIQSISIRSLLYLSDRR